MNLKAQVVSMIFSFVFGIVCMWSFIMLSNYQFYIRIIYRILLNVIFFSFFAVTYFLILRLINNGILHSYFLLFFVFGMIVVRKIVK